MTKHLSIIPLAAVLAVLTNNASAVPQPLVNTDLSTTLAKGSFEFENRVIWGHSGGADEVAFSHEIEYGLTDNLEVDLYLSEWNWSKEDGSKGHSRWESAGVELLYALSNPTADALGSAIAVETQFGNDFWVLEPQLRLQKNFGPVITVFNLVVANEFTKDEDDSQEISQSLGVAYQVCPNFFVGADVNHATGFTDWKDSEEEWYAGPALHFRGGPVWATIAASFKLSADADDAPDFNIGAKFGFNW